VRVIFLSKRCALTIVVLQYDYYTYTHLLINLNDTMPHDHRHQTPLMPLSIDFTTAQFDSHFAPPSGDTASRTPQMAVPGGASVLMKDSAGTSMALNLDIHPVYGTPILSGQAITAKGDVLEVHPCSCNDPVASRHNLPMTAGPEPSQGGSLFQEHHYPSPSSLSHVRQTPGRIRNRTPLVLVQTQLPSSSHTTELLQELEIPTATPGPLTNVNLKSPITPTPATVRQNSQTSSTGATYHTTQECLEEPSATRTAPNSRPLSQHDDGDVPPRLNSIPTVSTFDPDLEMPTISSPSSIAFSQPSPIGPLPSLPGSTVLSSSPLVTGAEQHRTPTVLNFNQPSSRGAASQEGREPSAAEVTAPDQPVATNDGNTQTLDRASDRDSIKPSENGTGSTSDLYTDRVAITIPMPTTRIESGFSPQYGLTAQPEPGPSLTVCIRIQFLVLVDLF
jgi:hypothetical protein